LRVTVKLDPAGTKLGATAVTPFSRALVLD
jgi:hypothetical protein